MDTDMNESVRAAAVNPVSAGPNVTLSGFRYYLHITKPGTTVVLPKKVGEIPPAGWQGEIFSVLIV
jgi:hypothetical protein